MTLSLHKKLFSLQQEVGIISKDATNPFFKNKYVNIDSLIQQLIPLLQKNRLLLLQPIENGLVTSRIICVDSDDAVESNLHIPDISDPQKLGSFITYCRRYTLLSLLGLPAEDDDANLASGKKPLLLNNTPEYARVVDYIANDKKADLVKIKIKYDMNNVMEQQLIKLINLNAEK
tara:strand:+ start:610 stop:1134 length:525 start_codon:yes stop_codon:yes gene_type:complete